MDLHKIFANTTPIQTNAQLMCAISAGTVLTTVVCGSFARDLHEGNYTEPQ